MDIASLIISILALLFALVATGYGIYIQNQTFAAMTGHLRGVETSAAGSYADMKELIGRISGMTDRLVDIQDKQFTQMLDAFVTRPQAVSEIAARSRDVATALEELSSSGTAAGEEEGQKLRLAALAKSASDVARRSEEINNLLPRMVGAGMMKRWFRGLSEDSDEPEPFVVDVVSLVGRVGALADAGEPAPRAAMASFSRMMMDPDDAIEVALQRGLVAEESDYEGKPNLVLTPKGQRLLMALRAGFVEETD